MISVELTLPKESQRTNFCSSHSRLSSGQTGRISCKDWNSWSASRSVSYEEIESYPAVS